ncbi:hypothetical protein Celal_4071 [Cellulophaga algicola DSM 14237]|uniref:Uncharacterized protein n=1 Tax=Cellulophaga algicola (strain DSM 14237 / IC166 / ACAM 630) TaxID=688270 RepID=E6XDX6_CELAD|nr:hypothetical protein Celal_4071 [Cellulophaga algicola DSM 14237]
MYAVLIRIVKKNSRHTVMITLCFIPKKPATQTAYLVFAKTQSQRRKTKRAILS